MRSGTHSLRQVKVFLLKGHQGFEGQGDYTLWSTCSFFHMSPQVWAAISVLGIQKSSDGIPIYLSVYQWMKWNIGCVCMHAKSFQWCPTLCDPMDGSPPDSSIHEIFQARILKWVAVPSSRGFSQPRDRTCLSYVSCIVRRVLYHQRHLRSSSATSFSLKKGRRL